jgi:DNA-binding Lrp family transcriptional regulator
MDLDRLDAAILRALLSDGRITTVQLGERIGLSATAAARRVQQLEKSGVIAGYGARVDLRSLGYELSAIVTITLERQSEEAMALFEDAVARCESVLWCRLMSGSNDYLLCIATRDIADFEDVHKRQLARLPGIARIQSSFTIREVVRRAAPTDITRLAASGTGAATARRGG